MLRPAELIPMSASVEAELLEDATTAAEEQCPKWRGGSSMGDGVRHQSMMLAMVGSTIIVVDVSEIPATGVVGNPVRR